MSNGSIFSSSASELKKFTREKMDNGLYTRHVILDVLNTIRVDKKGYFNRGDLAARLQKYKGEINVVREKTWGRRYPVEMLGWDDLMKLCGYMREEGKVEDFSEKKLKGVLDEIYKSLLIL